MKRAFEGVWIPRELYLHRELSWLQKLIIVEVRSFTHNQLPCFVSNEHLASHCMCSVSAIEKALRELIADGYLLRTRKKHNGTSTRFLEVNSRKICDWQTVKNAESEPYNLRPTNNNITNQPKRTKKESRPTNIEVVKEAFVQVGSNATEATKFFDYYETNGWKQGRGKPIVDWRAAARQWIARSAEWAAQKQSNGFDASRINQSSIADFIKHGTS